MPTGIRARDLFSREMLPLNGLTKASLAEMVFTYRRGKILL